MSSSAERGEPHAEPEQPDEQPVGILDPPPPPSELVAEAESLPTPLAQWEEAAIRGYLTMVGDGAHELYAWRFRSAHGAGEAEQAWRMTEVDLDRIAPPLTRILNRYDAIRRVAPASDPIAVAVGTGMWAWRSALQSAAAARRAEESAQRPEERAGYVSTDDDSIDPTTIIMESP
jgi:hypothetical protein